MKKLILLLLLLTPSSLIAEQITNTPKEEIKKVKKTIDDIEIIEGVPTKPYKKIQPLWENAFTMEGAIKKIKRKALKLEADAIINFETDTSKFETYSIWGGGGGSTPVVKGWAVQWVEDL